MSVLEASDSSRAASDVAWRACEANGLRILRCGIELLLEGQRLRREPESTLQPPLGLEVLRRRGPGGRGDRLKSAGRLDVEAVAAASIVEKLLE
eukprot:2280570-Pyramimonas_sp.AAC.1